ncbi:hypothetical protein [Leucobacter komagatae]|nr:hypothetical protein [Leucobacter komagatae]
MNRILSQALGPVRRRALRLLRLLRRDLTVACERRLRTRTSHTPW